MEESRIVCIGGGTGLSSILRGLKAYTGSLTAIVTVADNGGSSGDLRKDMKVLPPGDIRNCLLALAETEPVLEALFQHRFKDGSLKGHNLGNLFLVGLSELVGNFGQAVEMAHEVLRVKGRVLPVTLEDVQLVAHYDDGSKVVGECEIVAANKSHGKHILTMSLEPEKPRVYEHVLTEIEEADIILLGPGSLYTSIIPNLLVEGVVKALLKAKAPIVYIGNLMTQPGETIDYTLKEHVSVIEEYLGTGAIDYIIANDTWPDQETMRQYEQDGAQVVLPLMEDTRLITVPMMMIDQKTGYIRHDANHLAKVVQRLIDRKEKEDVLFNKG